MSRTKDKYKSEEKDTERLVRKAPKYRPPRTDLRRERVIEADPDLDHSDSDMSLNYKDIGGSMSEIGRQLQFLADKHPHISNQLQDLSLDFFDVGDYESAMVTKGMFSGLPRYEARRIASQYLTRVHHVSRYLGISEVEDLVFEIHSDLEDII